MKKILTILLCLVLSLSMAFAVGCGDSGSDSTSVGSDDPAFKGDYETATEQEILDFAEELESVQGAYDLDFTKGLKLESKYNYIGTSSEGADEETSDVSFLSSNKGNKFVMAGEMQYFWSLGSFTESAKEAKVYYNDGKCYANFDGKKVAVEMNVENIFDEGFSEVFSYLDFRAESLIEVDSIKDIIDELKYEFDMYGAKPKYSMEKTDEGTKVKIEASVKVDESYSEDGITMSMEGEVNSVVVFVFDVNNELIAYNFDMRGKGIESYGNETREVVEETTFSVVPYSGDVELPKDLDTYIGKSVA